jgi:3-hydroxybutyrate dehydrogenase
MPVSSTSPPFNEFPLDKWDAILAIVLSSTFHTTRAAVPGDEG